jgi:hypothetical protein
MRLETSHVVGWDVELSVFEAMAGPYVGRVSHVTPASDHELVIAWAVTVPDEVVRGVNSIFAVTPLAPAGIAETEN